MREWLKLLKLWSVNILRQVKPDGYIGKKALIDILLPHI